MGLENLGEIMVWKYPTLSPMADYKVRDTGSGITLEWNPQSNNPDLPNPLPTALEVMANEPAWLASVAAGAAEDSQYHLDREALLTAADGAVTDMDNAVADINNYLGSTPLSKTSAEVREQVRDHSVILRSVCQNLRGVVRLLKYAVKRNKI